MSKYEVVVEAVTGPLHLGEGPHWHDVDQALYFVDIFAQNVHRYHPETKTFSTLHIDGGPVTLVVPHAERPNTFIVSIGRSLATVTWPDPTKDTVVEEFKVIVEVDNDLPDNRFNDGKCDALGNLWAGTMGKTDIPDNVQPERGSLFRLNSSCKATTVIDKVSISNGLCWNADSSVLYFIDSCAFTVDALECNITTGSVGARRTVFNYSEQGWGPRIFPDGMTIDTKGNLWVASYGASKVHCINPVTGQLEGFIEVPCSNVTSVNWGGKDLGQLYITTTKKGLNEVQKMEQPLAGCVFRVSGLGVRGMKAIPCTVNLLGDTGSSHGPKTTTINQ
ncbi:regucalcin-like [Oratosquilla oratoria]|uniref:regucalcin-like n=1 Tax=Oratosquilla oratoria TaxID=337810 RepID=UPI003F75D670